MLADFQSINRDSLLSLTVTEALRVDLLQSSVVSLADRARVHKALTAMRRPAAAPLNEQAAREVASRLGSKAVVAGEIGRAGLGYILTARVITADSGRVLATSRQVARDSTVLVRAIERLSRALRARVGESLASVRASRPLGLATTSSFPALMKYHEARRADFFGNRARAIRLLEEATKLDPEFAFAWRQLSLYHQNNRERGPHLRAIERAAALADRLSDDERHMIRHSHALAVGDFHTAEAELLEIEPTKLDQPQRDRMASRRFRGRRALREPGNRSNPGGAARCELCHIREPHRGPTVPGQDRRSARHRLCLTAAGQIGGRWDHAMHWWIDLVEGRYEDAAARPIAGDGQRRDLEDFVRGRLGAARATLDRWVANGPPSRRAEATAFIALAEFFLRGDDEALDVVERLVHDTVPQGFSDQRIAELAVVLAMSGRVQAARRARATYEERIPERARWLDMYLLHATDAFIALAERRRDDAIAALRRARTSTPWTAPVDALLGRAYDRLGDPDSAIAAYTRYIETPWSGRAGIDGPLSDPWLLVPIHERLASLLMAVDRPAFAAHHAARVIEIWKDADAELRPRVDTARRILARARRQPRASRRLSIGCHRRSQRAESRCAFSAFPTWPASEPAGPAPPPVPG
ncbi:MAG: tetratricopeptide repeat protein [Longimicrobiales bacterium]